MTLLDYTRPGPADIVCVVGIHDAPEHKFVSFVCPGCLREHRVHVSGAPIYPYPKWRWCGSVDAPTLTPGIRGRDRDGRRCFVEVRDGHAHFWDRCDHELAGRTIKLDPNAAWGVIAGWGDPDGWDEPWWPIEVEGLRP